MDGCIIRQSQQRYWLRGSPAWYSASVYETVSHPYFHHASAESPSVCACAKTTERLYSSTFWRRMWQLELWTQGNSIRSYWSLTLCDRKENLRAGPENMRSIGAVYPTSPSLMGIEIFWRGEQYYFRERIRSCASFFPRRWSDTLNLSPRIILADAAADPHYSFFAPSYSSFITRFPSPPPANPHSSIVSFCAYARRCRRRSSNPIRGRVRCVTAAAADAADKTTKQMFSLFSSCHVCVLPSNRTREIRHFFEPTP